MAMPDHDLEKLLGGFAADTLTPEEKQQLYRTALDDQALFNALADEQALKELLADLIVRRRLLQSLQTPDSAAAGDGTSWLDWFHHPSGVAWAGGFATVVLAAVLGTRIYQDSLKEAARSVVTEEAKPPTPSASAPPIPQRTTPPLAEPQLQQQEHKQSTAAAAKKEALTSTRSKRELTSPTRSEEHRAREQDRLQQPTESLSDALGQSKEDAPDSADHTRSATSPLQAPASAPAPMQAPAIATATGQTASALSARDLFYGEMGRSSADSMVRENQFTKKPLGQPGQRFKQLEQHSELLRAGKTAGTIASPQPLGIRYSLIPRRGDELPRDTGDQVANQASPIDLTIESNQDGDLQIWAMAGATPPQLLFPPIQEQSMPSKLTARQRLNISIPAEYTTVIVRFFRTHNPTVLPDIPTFDQPTPGQLQESFTTDEDQSTYIVNRDSARSELSVSIPMSKP